MPKRINLPAPPKPKRRRPKPKRTKGTTSRRVKYWEEDFFKAFREFGIMSRACIVAGVHRKTVYDRRHSDAVFRARFDECQCRTLAKFEGIAHKMAEGYRDESGTEHRPNTTMLRTVLQALDPATYGGRARVEITGGDGGPIVIGQSDVGSRLAEIAKDPKAMDAMRYLAQCETKKLTDSSETEGPDGSKEQG